MILKNTKLKNKLRDVLKSHPEVKDVIVFGSIVRGKIKPSDIDILVLFEDKVDKSVEYKIRKILEHEYESISIISKTQETILDEAFDARESILFEGKSLLTRDTLGERLGFSPLGMIKYDFKEWSKLDKTKFYYALNGRGDNEGISDQLNCIKLSDRIVLVPLENIEKFREFLDSWNIEYKYFPILIPARLNKKKILQ